MTVGGSLPLKQKIGIIQMIMAALSLFIKLMIKNKHLFKSCILSFLFFSLSFAQTDSVLIKVTPGWNLLSLPFIGTDIETKSLFPDALSPAFKYEHKYSTSDTLYHGHGYWLKSIAPGTVTIFGKQSYEDSILLNSGWNLIGGFSFPTHKSKLFSSPLNIRLSNFYKYKPDSGYVVVDSLVPGEGYWVKSDSDGLLSASQWEHLGLENEGITAIGVNPSNPNIVYAGSNFDINTGRAGRIFKSIDGGETWDTIWGGLRYYSIKIDPVHPDTVYALDESIIKTTDGGATWQWIADSIDLREKMVSFIAIDPFNTQILYAGTRGIIFGGGSLYKSSNGGITWIDILTPDDSLKNGVNSLAIDPNNSNILYAGTGQGEIRKSTDAGETWHATGWGITGTGINAIVIDPRNSNRILSAIAFWGFIESLDGANSWHYINEGIQPHELFNGRKLIINALTFNLYAVSNWDMGGEVLCRLDGDSSWSKIGLSMIQMGYYYSDLAISSDGKNLYFGTDNGIYKLVLK